MPRHSPYALYSLNFCRKGAFAPSTVCFLSLRSNSLIVVMCLFTLLFAFLLAICSFFTHKTEKPLIFLSLVFLNYLFVFVFLCVFSHLIRFSMNTLNSFFFSAVFSALVGSSGLEPPPSRLSGARSNHLSYEPVCLCDVVSFPCLHLWWR